MKTKIETETVIMGATKGKYFGQFSPAVEKIIKDTIGNSVRVLHLFSGKSKIGTERIDITQPEATKNMDVFEFVMQDKRDWDWVILDPPYDIQRKDSKMREYGEKEGVFGNILHRRLLWKFFQKHAKNVLWLDYIAFCPKGFYRKKLWLILPCSYSHVRVLSHLKKQGENLNNFIKEDELS